MGHLGNWPRYGLAGDAAVQNFGVKIDVVGPDDRSDIDIHAHLGEEVLVLQWRQYPSFANNPWGEIDAPDDPVGERQFQLVIIEISNRLHVRLKTRCLWPNALHGMNVFRAIGLCQFSRKESGGQGLEHSLSRGWGKFDRYEPIGPIEVVFVFLVHDADSMRWVVG